MAARPGRTTAGQLALELPLALPTIALAPSGRSSSGCGATPSTRCARTWRASRLPSPTRSSPATRGPATSSSIPFSGRGTTPLQACAEGRIGVGNDLNPFAHLLTAAKVEPPTRRRRRPGSRGFAWPGTPSSRDWLALGARVGGRSRSTRLPSCRAPARGRLPADGVEPVPAEVALAFHPRTLAQLLFVRSSLDLDDRIDRFLAAAITGILHGKSPTYLSELMPNTFSMAPRYVRDFAARTAFKSPERDVFACLDAKLDRLYRQPPPSIERDRPARRRPRRRRRAPGPPCARAACADRARLVVTSPPYLRVVKYGYYNWLRTWFLRLRLRARSTPTLDDAHHREPYLLFLRDVLAGLRPVLTDDAVVVLVIGDVETDRGRPISGRHRARRAGLGGRRRARRAIRLAGVAVDDVAAHRKMTKLWGDEAGRATKTDRILVLGADRSGPSPERLAGRPPQGCATGSWPPEGPALPCRMRPCSRCTTRPTWRRWTRWS